MSDIFSNYQIFFQIFLFDDFNELKASLIITDTHVSF